VMDYDEPTSKYQESPLDVDDGHVGNLNCTPCHVTH